MDAARASHNSVRPNLLTARPVPTARPCRPSLEVSKCLCARVISTSRRRRRPSVQQRELPSTARTHRNEASSPFDLWGVAYPLSALQSDSQQRRVVLWFAGRPLPRRLFSPPGRPRQKARPPTISRIHRTESPSSLLPSPPLLLPPLLRRPHDPHQPSPNLQPARIPTFPRAYAAPPPSPHPVRPARILCRPPRSHRIPYL